MGLLDSILGSVLGGGGANSPLGSILSSILGGGGGGGLGGLLQQLGRAGHGETANSWVSNGPNRPIDPGALRDVFGHERVGQWSRQTGMSEGDILSQLSNLLPGAVDRMTPNGQVPEGARSGATRDNPFHNANAGSGSPFDDPGTELPPR